MNHSYCQSAMGWKDNSDFSGLYDTTRPNQFVGYMESHDEERCAYKQIEYGNGALKNQPVRTAQTVIIQRRILLYGSRSENALAIRRNGV